MRIKPTIEKQHNGSLLLSDIVNNQYFKKVYYGYSIAEAKRDFQEYVSKNN